MSLTVPVTVSILRLYLVHVQGQLQKAKVVDMSFGSGRRLKHQCASIPHFDIHSHPSNPSVSAKTWWIQSMACFLFFLSNSQLTFQTLAAAPGNLACYLV